MTRGADAERWPRIEAILREALDAPEERRGRILDAACGADAALRAEVEELLAADANAGGFLSTPAAEAAGGLLADWAAGEAGERPDATGRTIGPYRILGRLGEGGMGVVYEAEQESPRRTVALKLIRGEGTLDPYQVRLFERESSALARLTHPAIATIHEAGRTADGQPFFAMELVRGKPLGQWRESRDRGAGNREERERRLGVWLQVCDAIAYAHQRGVIHRDLKPSNIVVLDEPARRESASAPADRVKVLDFGLARIVDSDVALTQSGSEGRLIQGTLPYMSPEQARGDPAAIDVRSDVYSLGILLYELLAGRLPYDVPASPLHEGVRAVVESAPRRPSGIERALGGDLETIILKALEKDPAARYQSVSALADDVRRYLDNHPILARPPSTLYQLRKIVGRHKGPFALAAALLLAVLAGITGTTTGMLRARRAEAEAREEAETARHVSDFLVGLFEDSDPLIGKGLETTVGDFLGRGSEQIENRLQDQPRVKARVLSTIGTVYRNMGDYEAAGRHARESLALRESVHGVRHPDVAKSRRELGMVLLMSGQLDSARAYLASAVEIGEKLEEPDEAELATALYWLGATEADAGDPARGRELFERALAIRERLFDPQSAEVATSLDALGAVLGQIGEYDEAIRLKERSLAIEEENRGPDHQLVATIVNNIGVVHMHAGHLPEARAAYERALRIWEKTLSSDHPQIGAALGNLGEVKCRMGDFDGVEPLLKRALAIAEKTYGPEHYVVAMDLSNLASFYRDTGEYAKSLAFYDRSQALFEKTLGPQHPYVAQNLEEQALLARKMGDSTRAGELEERARRIQASAPPSSDS